MITDKFNVAVGRVSERFPDIAYTLFPCRTDEEGSAYTVSSGKWAVSVSLNKGPLYPVYHGVPDKFGMRVGLALLRECNKHNYQEGLN